VPLLSWHNRDADLTRASRTPYRLLEPVASLSYGEPDASNMLIEGDNLDALKALLPYYAGQVKCIFIDPPYNTRSAFEHYDDNLEHSQWLSMMYPRLELLHRLLAENGTLWITIDDNEAHYLKVLVDEVFDRRNFLADFTWIKKRKPSYLSKIGTITEHVLCYAKRKASAPELTIGETSEDETYPLYNAGNTRGVLRFRAGSMRFPKAADGHVARRDFAEKTSLVRLLEDFSISGGTNATEVVIEGEWRYSQDSIDEQLAMGDTYIVKSGKFRPRRVRSAGGKGKKIHNLLSKDAFGVGTYEDSAAEAKLFGFQEDFDYPKPESLLRFILEAATDEGDLVLDSFLGSGTTAAVAHKMGRRWIGIATGGHARTHARVRLAKVVDGEQGGVSAATGWSGGGGFRFYTLGAAVLDEKGGIRDDIRFEHLAAHVWFSETGTPWPSRAGKDVFLGSHEGTGYYLLFNGILGERSRHGGNVLTRRLLRSLPPFAGPKKIYGEASELTGEQLAELGIRFRQTPYDIRAR
jgi:adenine-specific DNA-methyltransferase